jgi:hypothetical protein
MLFPVLFFFSFFGKGSCVDKGLAAYSCRYIPAAVYCLKPKCDL